MTTTTSTTTDAFPFIDGAALRELRARADMWDDELTHVIDDRVIPLLLRARELHVAVERARAASVERAKTWADVEGEEGDYDLWEATGTIIRSVTGRNRIITGLLRLSDMVHPDKALALDIHPTGDGGVPTLDDILEQVPDYDRVAFLEAVRSLLRDADA